MGCCKSCVNEGRTSLRTWPSPVASASPPRKAGDPPGRYHWQVSLSVQPETTVVGLLPGGCLFRYHDMFMQPGLL
jgi:hypothetical protein